MVAVVLDLYTHPNISTSMIDTLKLNSKYELHLMLLGRNGTLPYVHFGV